MIEQFNFDIRLTAATLVEDAHEMLQEHLAGGFLSQLPQPSAATAADGVIVEIVFTPPHRGKQNGALPGNAPL